MNRIATRKKSCCLSTIARRVNITDQGRVMAMKGMFADVYAFYRDGFRSMTLGRTLWKIVLIKLVILFAVLKLFFFPDYLHTTYPSDTQRAGHVLGVLTGQDAVPPPGRPAETRSP